MVIAKFAVGVFQLILLLPLSAAYITTSGNGSGKETSKGERKWSGELDLHPSPTKQRVDLHGFT
jgi:hypothetical protein